MRMNEINSSKVGAWLFFVGLGLVLLCGLIPEVPVDPIVEIASWMWTIAIIILLCNLIDKIIIKLKKQKGGKEKEKTDT